MLALLFTIALFAVWCCIGLAVLAALRAIPMTTPTVLVGPAVGLTVLVLLTFLLNLVGWPVAAVAWPILCVSVVLAAIALWRYRPPLKLRELAPFSLALVLALIANGRPMFAYGFEWLSVANDDMANYSLGAARLAQHGFFDVPTVMDLVDGTDYTLSYWFFHGHRMVRHGTELILAWASSLTGLTTVEVYMPVTLAFTLVLVCATAALVVRTRAPLWTGLATAVLLSLSPMNTLSIVLQIAPQVAGIALVAALAAVLLVPGGRFCWSVAARMGVLVGGLGAALLLVYPEVAIFLAVGAVVYHSVRLLRREADIRYLAAIIGVAGVAAAVVLNIYTVESIPFLLKQANVSLSSPDIQNSRFPYFLVPTGIADLWGFQALQHVPTEPWLSISIGAGIALLIASIVAAGVLTWRGHAVAALTLAMALVGSRIALGPYDYGLFKLAMFVQPFLLGTVVLACCALFRRGWLQVIPLVVLGMVGIPTQLRYISVSEGVGAGSVIRDASASGINLEFQKLVQGLRAPQLTLDTADIAMAKFETIYLRGTPSQFLSRYFFNNITEPDSNSPSYRQAATERSAIDQRLLPMQFDLHSPADPGQVNNFLANEIGDLGSGCGTLITTTGDQSIVNRRVEQPDVPNNFTAQSCDRVHDYLVFVHSSLGQHYDLPDEQPNVSMYQLEQDPLVPGKTFSGLGRYLMFEILNPSSQVRLMLEMTTTLNSDSNNALPPAAVIGRSRESLQMPGRGSARVFSPVLVPQVIGNRAYIAIDMGVDGKHFDIPRPGLMGLFGTNVPLDPRLLVGFGRGIALIPDSVYEALQPPSEIRTFPGDLENPDLSYSGLYEDGWLGDSAYVRLAQPAGATHVTVAGMVPMVGATQASTKISVMVDGQQVINQPLDAGEFRVSAPLPPGQGIREISLRFDGSVNLPSPDSRPVAAQLHQVSLGGPD